MTCGKVQVARSGGKLSQNLRSSLHQELSTLWVMSSVIWTVIDIIIMGPSLRSDNKTHTTSHISVLNSIPDVETQPGRAEDN